VLGVLVVLVGAGVGVWTWALTHWFVGVDGTGGAAHVAVFRGLPASVAGVDLYERSRATDLAVADLTPAARSRVQKGITADDPAGAQRILAALRDQRLPVCPPAPDGTPAASASVPAGSTAPTSSAPPTGAASTPAAPMVPGVDCREGK
jgi:protein phosphatase